jgi:hypothetical protein
LKYPQQDKLSVHPALKKTLLAGAIVVVNLPLAGIGTLLGIPFWRWLEERTAIESIGHSGPAGWCFVAVYVLTTSASLAFWGSSWARAKRPPRS